MWDLDQDPAAVPGVLLAAAGATVHEVLQDREGLRDDGVRLPAVHIDDEPDTTGVVLVSRVVETLRGMSHPFRHHITLVRHQTVRMRPRPWGA